LGGKGGKEKEKRKGNTKKVRNGRCSSDTLECALFEKGQRVIKEKRRLGERAGVGGERKAKGFAEFLSCRQNVLLGGK